MVRLYEYQGKQILRAVGLLVPEGDVATTPAEARQIAEKIGAAVAVKSQVLATGRFKAGGIKFATSPNEAEKVASEILGIEIKGYKVDKVLVEQKLNLKQEFYVGIIVNDSYKVKAPVVMISTQGGVDIEEVAAKSPEKVTSQVVDIFRGLTAEDALQMVKKLQMPAELQQPVSKAALGLYEAFRKYDARAAEINPIVLTFDGKIYAADCRITIDDASVRKHPDLGIEVARESNKPFTELERKAWKIEENDFRGIAYLMQLATEIKEPGFVGFHGIGGGGAMLGADALVRHGLKLADYADTSGNPTASKVYRVAKLILSLPGIDGYILMGPVIASQEQWHHAHGLVKAFREELKDRAGFPVIILIAGNKEAEAIEILREGLKDLPIRLEIYGRDYVYKVDEVAERMKRLIEDYRKSRGA